MPPSVKQEFALKSAIPIAVDFWKNFQAVGLTRTACHRKDFQGISVRFQIKLPQVIRKVSPLRCHYAVFKERKQFRGPIHFRKIWKGVQRFESGLAMRKFRSANVLKMI